MTRQRQKDLERRHLDLFRELLHKVLHEKVPGGALACSENPDFVIEHSGGKLGIEHTLLFKGKPEGERHSPQEKVVLRGRIVHEACELYTKWGHPPLSVTVFFDSALDYDVQNRLPGLIARLEECVSTWVRGNPSQSSHILHPDDEIPEITRILIHRYPDQTKSYSCSRMWKVAKIAWVATYFIHELQDRLTEKDAKKHRYSPPRGSCWLLVVADKSNPAQAFDMSYRQKVQDHKYASKFARVFFMEVTERFLTELRLIRPEDMLPCE